MWFLVFAAMTAGIAEETLFRGYAFERVAELTGSYAAGRLHHNRLVRADHLRLWGWGPVVAFMVSGGALTLFYAWREDLLANIVAHAIVDVCRAAPRPRRRART